MAKPKVKAPPAPAEPLGKRRPRHEDVAPVLEMVSDGQSVRAAALSLGIHPGQMHAILSSTPELCAQYASAREARAEVFQEQMISIGMAAATGRTITIEGEKRTIKADGARVALDAIKWATARMAPKTAPIERHSHSFENLSDAELDAQMRALESKMRGDAGSS